ncbi:MAG: lysozyme [Psychrobacter sp.]|nr:lysozyme [Psychrobacter sp.]
MTQITQNVSESDSFFAWLRQQQANKRLNQSQVDAANELIAVMLPSDLKNKLAVIAGWGTGQTMSLSQSGIDKLCEYEGFESHPYKDSAGKWTIGYGSTYYENNQPVKSTDKPISKERALQLKQNIVNRDFAPAVNTVLSKEISEGKITQNMFDMLVSLAYNIGAARFATSAVVKYLHDGDKNAAANAFLLWNKVRNPVTRQLEFSKGLYRRREKERDYFLA